MSKELRTLVVQNPVKDHPASELRAVLADLIDQGYTVHPKFTCEHCHERVLADLINCFPVYFTCPRCGGLHDFDKSGGNYSLSQLVTPNAEYPDALAAFKAWRKQAHGY